MKKPNLVNDTSRSDFINNLIEMVSRFLMWVGLGFTVLGVAATVWTYAAFAGDTPPGNPAQALSNIGMLQNGMIIGLLALYIGTALIYWGEETLGAIQLGAALALIFSPQYLPSLLAGGKAPTEVSGAALSALSTTGLVGALIGTIVLVIDLVNRAKQRMTIGARLEQMKYGKGVKEELNKQNIFMGKCWQLPFCRKFVREACPIYHSRRTCWREQVGCMCEESVIRDAMAGKTIPKDAVAAAKFIPVNNKLTVSQKQDRCRQCVIFNEHQKHKYKLAMPTVFVGFVLFYVAFRIPLLALTSTILSGLDRAFGRITFSKQGAVQQQIESSGLPFQELILICGMIIALAYAIKMVEYAIFKLKI